MRLGFLAAVLLLPLLSLAQEDEGKVQAYCKRYQRNYAYWCRGDSRRHDDKSAKFCRVYPRKCPQVVETAEAAAKDEEEGRYPTIAASCAKQAGDLERVCRGADPDAVPPEYKQHCEVYLANCPAGVAAAAPPPPQRSPAASAPVPASAPSGGGQQAAHPLCAQYAQLAERECPNPQTEEHRQLCRVYATNCRGGGGGGGGGGDPSAAISAQCAQYASIGERFCRGDPGQVPAQFRAQCQLYVQNCPAGGGGGGGSPGAGVSAQCAQYAGLGERYCRGDPAQIPAQFRTQCQLYVQNCPVGGGGGAGGESAELPPEVKKQIEERCAKHKKLAETYCFNGTPLDTANLKRCAEYRQFCLNDPSVAGGIPGPFGQRINQRPNDRLGRIQGIILDNHSRGNYPRGALDPRDWRIGSRGLLDSARYAGPVKGYRTGFGPRKSLIGVGTNSGISVLGPVSG